MSSKELIWSGRFIVDREDSIQELQELWVNIGFLDKNKRNETTFNWDPGMNIIFVGNTHRTKHIRNNCCSIEKIPQVLSEGKRQGRKESQPQ